MSSSEAEEGDSSLRRKLTCSRLLRKMSSFLHFFFVNVTTNPGLTSGNVINLPRLETHKKWHNLVNIQRPQYV